MEKLLAGEDGTSERRKSIKTYREIVQEKWVLSVVFLHVQWYLDVLFKKIVGYRKGSDANITRSWAPLSAQPWLLPRSSLWFLWLLTLWLFPLPCSSFRERRERELHEAYKNARSQEEAEGILQQYIERFTISEAVLERLEMPKILERSHSTEPNLTPFLNDPSPMKYLRRQSLPPPKFTATVETTIARTSVLDTSMSAGIGSPSKTVTPKAVPMLTPKPYSQPKNSQEVLKTFKVGRIP